MKTLLESMKQNMELKGFSIRTQIKITDIDSKHMLVKLHGKGEKERYTLLSQVVLETLWDYWKYYRPAEWLFHSNPSSKTFL